MIHIRRIEIIGMKCQLYRNLPFLSTFNIQTWTPPSRARLALSAKARWNATVEKTTPRGAWTSATEVDFPLPLNVLASKEDFALLPPYWICRLAQIKRGSRLPSGPLLLVPCWSIRQLSVMVIRFLMPWVMTAFYPHFLITSCTSVLYIANRGWFKLVVGFRTSFVKVASGFWKTISAYPCTYQISSRQLI